MTETSQREKQLQDENAALRARCDQLESEVFRGADAERKLRSAQEKLRSVAESSHDLILLASIDGAVQFINRNSANRMFEPPLQGLLYDALDPRDRIEVSECLQRVRQSQRPDRYEISHTLASGRVVRLEGNVAPVLEGTNVAAFAITMRDVTHRRRMETAMRSLVEGTSHKKGTVFLRSLVEQLAHALDCRYAMLGLLLPGGDRVRTTALWNGDVIGEDIEYELKGTPCSDVVRQQFCCYVKDVTRLFPRDRLLLEMQAESYLGMPLVSTSGETLGLLAALDTRPMEINPETRSIMRIFAQHAEAELERSAAEEALEESQRNFELAQARASIGTWTFDPAAQAGVWSKQMYELFRYDAELGPPPWDEFLLLVHPDDRDFVIETHASVLEGIERVSLDFRTNPARGPQRYIHTVMALIRRADGNLLLLGTSSDITGRKLAEQEREELITQLEQKNAELERFTYTVSHDLKSPLITIKGFAGMLARDLDEDHREAVAEDLEEIATAADRMGRMLDELLHLSRIGRTESIATAAAFDEIVAESLVNLSQRIAERKVEIRKCQTFPVVYGDRVRLLEVVQNLVDNAIKFSLGEIPVVEIGVRGEPPVFYVRDEGLGIPTEYHERIFDLFEQLDPQRGGSGVGLAIVKRIIELHGGRIWVESPGPNLGSTFFFTIPQDHERTTTETM